MLDEAVESLTTDRLGLGAALGNVGAEHCADSWVHSEAPGEFLAIWIATVVFSQVPGKHRESPSYELIQRYQYMQVGD